MINEQFNVYVSVNAGADVISEPDDAALGAAFTVDLQDGDNVVRVRLASKVNTHGAESYGGNAFYYKVAGVEFIIAGQSMDTTGTCSEDDISLIADDCTHDITNPMPQFGVVGTLDNDDRVSVRIGRNFAGLADVADQSDLQGANERIRLDLEPGRHLLRLWADENGDPGGAETHFFRVNVVPYWEWNGNRLSKDSDCQSPPVRTLAQITDDDCIVTQFGNTGELRFHNVIAEQFYVYVSVNAGTNIINEPDDAALGAAFTVDLQDGDNLLRVRLASKSSQPYAETYGNNAFYYKVAATDVLVSNLGQDRDASAAPVSPASKLAAKFTTGNNTRGYEISKVRLPLSVESASVTPVVSIYSDNSGEPGDSIKPLTNLTSITVSATTPTEVEFDAGGYKLLADTPYWIVIEKPSGSDEIYVDVTASDSEDAGRESNWSIGNTGSGFVNPSWVSFLHGRGFPIAIKGALAESDDATLSDLALTDPDDNNVPLIPAFASDVESYTATVANAVDRITVEPTKNDANATVVYLDSVDATLTDANLSTPEFDLALSEGENVFKVKVTAEDTSTTKTYAVTVTRVDFLVSNAGSTAGINLSIGSVASAIQFTTGSNAGGYNIDTLQLRLEATGGTTLKVSIYSDSSGQPGSSLKVLTPTGTIPTSIQQVDFDAGDYRLDPNTKYWIVLQRTSGAFTDFTIGTTESTAEDPGTAEGWSIGNDRYADAAGWADVSGVRSIPQFSIKGDLVTESDDATLSDLALKDADDNTITLEPAFASDVESYTATVANAVEQITVEPTRNDANATVVYLDSTDTELTDADGSTTDVFDVDLSEGETVVKVKVTAEDTSTTKTYTVTVTRVDFLVSNLGQRAPDYDAIGLSRFARTLTGSAVSFTTGSNPGGYLVSAARLRVATVAVATPRVSIYSDISGRPGSPLKTLNNPTNIRSFTQTQFDDVEIVPGESDWARDFGADNFKLAKDTTYWVVIERASGSGGVIYDYTGSLVEDSGTAPGWSIDGAYDRSDTQTWLNADSTVAPMQFSIKGDPVPESDDATLSDLVLTDPDDYIVTLVPAFASDVESYTATVENFVDRITVEPTRNDANATVTYLDSTDATLTDADGGTTKFDVALGEGETVVKVKVTAEDGETTKTYTVTVTVTPADFLVSNLGQEVSGMAIIGVADRGQTFVATAVPFTTGNNPDGYTITAVSASIGVVTGTAPRVSIYSDSSNGPASSLKVLTNPTGITSVTQSEYDSNIRGFQEHDFGADNFKLQPSTWYWVVFERASGSGAVMVNYTISLADDPGGAPGWSILRGVDGRGRKDTQTWATANTFGFWMLVAVKGEPAKPPITLASDLDRIIRELHEVTFTLTRQGPTTEAADVTLVVENATGSSVITSGPRSENLTFAMGDATVEFAVPISWIGTSAGSFVATVEAGPEYDASGATATVEVGFPTALMEISLDKTSYEVDEGDTLTFDVVFNVLEQIAAPNKEFEFGTLRSVLGTAGSPGDYVIFNARPHVPAAAWSLVGNRYTATAALTLETLDDALYERPMGADEDLEIELRRDTALPSWATLEGPSAGLLTGSKRYPVTIIDNETLSLDVTLSSPGLTAGASLRIAEDAGESVTLQVSSPDTASDGNPVQLPPGVKLTITPDTPTTRGATKDDDWTIDVDEIALDGVATITLVNDTDEEGPERVFFKVGFADDPEFQSATATLIIDDDEYTGPVLASAEIDGATLTLEFSNTLDTGSRPAAGSFTVKVRGTAVDLASFNPVSISGSAVTLRLASPVTAGDTVTVSYTAPTANPIRDTDALDAPSFDDERVTNNTPNAPPTGRPVISGNAEAGQTLTASTDGIRDDDGLSNPRFSFNWVRVDGGTETVISNSPSYLLTKDDVGKKIRVRVAFYDDAETRRVLESNPFPSSGTIQNKPNREPTGRPTITGQYEVGHTLTASTSGIDDADGLTSPGYSYQWQRLEGGVYTDIGGADAMVYTLTPEDEGKRVRVEATFTDDDSNVHMKQSATTGTVQPQTSIPADKVEVSLDATAYVVREGESVDITITLAAAPKERVYMPYRITRNGETSHADYRATHGGYNLGPSGNFRFGAGTTEKTVTFTAKDDELNDDGESLTFCLVDLPEPYAVRVGQNCGTVNIKDTDDPNSVTVSFRYGNYYAPEDGSPAWVRVSVEPVPDREIIIPITFTYGGGLSDDDHTTVAANVTFGPDVRGGRLLTDDLTYASRPIEIWALDDSLDDDGEYLDLTFGPMPPFVSEDTDLHRGGKKTEGFWRPANQSRVWFQDNDFTPVPANHPVPNREHTPRLMGVTFSADTYTAYEGEYEDGEAATVRVLLDRNLLPDRAVTIPIIATWMDQASSADVIRTAIPSSITFRPGQTEQTFRVAARNDSDDDDGEWLELKFGTLPTRVTAGNHAIARVNLVDDDVPEVEISFAQDSYEVTSIEERDGSFVSARIEIPVRLSAVPERFVDVGIVAKSTQGDGYIRFGYSAYVPRGPYSGAAFRAGETEFRLIIVVSAFEEFDANQTYRLSFGGMPHRVSAGSPSTVTITVNTGP